MSVSPSANTTYTATITGPGGSITRQAAVTVTPAGFNATIQVPGGGAVNLRSLANANGYNGTQAATITFVVGAGVTVAGAGGNIETPSGGLAIDTGTWPTGSHAIALTLTVNGVVRGGGGNGGNGGDGGQVGQNGGGGGDGVVCRLPLTINVASGGEISGGGAGGRGGNGYDPAPLFFGDETDGGGGGGGGQPNGGGGSGGSGDTEGAGGSSGADGAVGTASTGGAGGAGGSSNAGTGQSGAAFGGNTTGANGGFAVRKNGHTVTVNNSGLVRGSVG